MAESQKFPSAATFKKGAWLNWQSN